MIDDMWVSPELFEKFPDYSVVALNVQGVRGGPSNEYSDQLLQLAENSTRQLLNTTPLEELSEFNRWRAAFESFGVKPRVARSSFEALMRRVDKGLSHIDLLTDSYNAVSVLHRVPIGGENLDAYSGVARLTIATGDETFDTRENGETVLQHRFCSSLTVFAMTQRTFHGMRQTICGRNCWHVGPMQRLRRGL